MPHTRHTGSDIVKQFYNCAKKLQQGLKQCQLSSSSSSSCVSTTTATKMKTTTNNTLSSTSKVSSFSSSSSSSSCSSINTDNNNTLPPIYIASDHPQTKDEFQTYDNETIHYPKELQIIHVDRSKKQDYNDPNQAALDVWAELKILIDSTCLVYSRSGFSELAAYVGSLPRCAIKFDECNTKQQVQLALQNIGC